jgi:hypothetical protein
MAIVEGDVLGGYPLVQPKPLHKDGQLGRRVVALVRARQPLALPVVEALLPSRHRVREVENHPEPSRLVVLELVERLGRKAHVRARQPDGRNVHLELRVGRFDLDDLPVAELQDESLALGVGARRRQVALGFGLVCRKRQ